MIPGGPILYRTAHSDPPIRTEIRMSGDATTRFEELIDAQPAGLHGSPLADYLSDPFRFFAWSRAEAPVLHLPQVDCWTVARYDDIAAVLRNPEAFSPANTRQPVDVPLCPRAKEVLRSSGIRLEPALMDEEPPTHHRHRRIFGEGLSGRRVAHYERRIRSTVSRQLDGFVDEGRADLVAQFLHPVTYRMAFHLLGGADDDFDLADWPGRKSRVSLWIDMEAAQVTLAEMAAHLWTFAGRLIAGAGETPGDSYLGNLVRRRRVDPSLFTENYLRNVVGVLLAAGGDTQVHSLATGIHAMLEDGRQWERLCADPGLIPNAVEEIVRYGCPILAWPRLASRDTEIGGRKVPAGGRILLLLPSANRDETVFPDGERLIVDRGNARRHLSFGVGPHYCLGASLAQLQLKIILEELTRTLPRMRLADRGPPDILRELTFRGLKRLPVRWD